MKDVFRMDESHCQSNLKKNVILQHNITSQVSLAPLLLRVVIVAIVETKSSRATPETTVVAKISLLAIAGIAVLGCKVDGHINSLLANQRLHDPSLGGAWRQQWHCWRYSGIDYLNGISLVATFS